MTVTVRLFARARDLAGAGDLTLEVPAGETVGGLRRALGARCPALIPLLSRSAIAVNGELAGDEQGLAAGAEIALLPPVSGG